MAIRQGLGPLARGSRRAAAVARARLRPRLGLLRPLAALAVLGLFAWLLRARVEALDPARIGAALGAVRPGQWAAGLLFTAVSFWAVGRYDRLVHRLMRTGVPDRAAMRAGITAIAIGQTVGLGALSGALVRWRMLPGLSLARATALSVAVALTFLAGWAVLAALAVLVAPPPLPGARALAGLALAAAAGLAGLALWRPPALSRLALPPLRAMAAALGLVALDTAAAATVLWLLLPGGAGPGAVLPAYLLALGAGLLLTTPGGLGPFEAALLALLPGIAAEDLLAAVIAYRALYYALPALAALPALLRGPGRRAPAPPPGPGLLPPAATPELPFLLDARVQAAPRAEAALLRHGRLGLITDAAGRPAALAAPAGQSLVLLHGPLAAGADPGALVEAAARVARAGFRAPVLYKAPARLAAAARARGWAVLPVADEAWLDPRRFAPAGAAHRQLRRKLRKAEAAGLAVRCLAPGAPLPLGEMAEIARGWAAAHGGERGFSMGAWAPGTLPWARVALARGPSGRLEGFVTCHANAAEHTLDLMRARADAPEGTMQALVAAAIAAAGQAGVPRFSLAAVPRAPAAGEPAALAGLRARIAAAAGAEGLRQFKASFAPRWEPLYIAAPSRVALGLGGWDVAREITRPAGS